MKDCIRQQTLDGDYIQLWHKFRQDDTVTFFREVCVVCGFVNLINENKKKYGSEKNEGRKPKNKTIGEFS